MRSSSIFEKIEVVFHISSSWVKIWLHTKNQLPRLHRTALIVIGLSAGVGVVWFSYRLIIPELGWIRLWELFLINQRKIWLHTCLQTLQLKLSTILTHDFCLNYGIPWLYRDKLPLSNHLGGSWGCQALTAF